MFNLYSFEPMDTLFFKGAEPMDMGESHSSNLVFPPAIQTLEGAIRTKLYNMDKEKYADLIKVGEEKPGFNLLGPFFIKESKLYLPTPYSWFAEKESLKENKKIKIIKSKEETTKLIKGNNDKLVWSKGEKGELESLGGTWIHIEDFYKNSSECEILKSEDFYCKEVRTGIALDKYRSVREGHIYSFTHIRLLKDVNLACAIDVDLPFDDKTILTLGAEKRFGKFKRLNQEFTIKDSGNFYMNLSIVESDIVQKNCLVSTGKPLSIGGWDLHKKFHKPMKTYYPAGSVFNKKINENFISL
jgi:CRISPR-associated protein Cmr3